LSKPTPTRNSQEHRGPGLPIQQRTLHSMRAYAVSVAAYPPRARSSWVVPIQPIPPEQHIHPGHKPNQLMGRFKALSRISGSLMGATKRLSEGHQAQPHSGVAGKVVGLAILIVPRSTLLRGIPLVLLTARDPVMLRYAPGTARRLSSERFSYTELLVRLR
jgi:hypothetical protein